MARDVPLLCSLTNYELAFFGAIFNKKAKHSPWVRVGGQPAFGREATLIAAMSG